MLAMAAIIAGCAGGRQVALDAKEMKAMRGNITITVEELTIGPHRMEFPTVGLFDKLRGDKEVITAGENSYFIHLSVLVRSDSKQTMTINLGGVKIASSNGMEYTPSEFYQSSFGIGDVRTPGILELDPGDEDDLILLFIVPNRFTMTSIIPPLGDPIAVDTSKKPSHSKSKTAGKRPEFGI